jgi:hypothetical protein
MNYKHKYFKYKKKYLDLKKQIGGYNKIYDFLNFILSNTFLNFKQSELNKQLIRSLVIDCISLTEILDEVYDNVTKVQNVISVPQQKAELDMIKKSINFSIESDFLLSLGATQEILNYLKMDPEGKIYKDPKDKTFIYNLYQIQNILEFSLQDTDNPINLQVGELIWSHLTFLCEKYLYLLNLYKIYKITSNILFFNDEGVSKLCSLFNNNRKCLKIDNLCVWKDKKCDEKKEKDAALFNYEEECEINSEDSYEDISENSSEESYDPKNDPENYKINYNTKLMKKISENFPFQFIEFFLNINFENFKIISNRNKYNQSLLIRRIGDYSENLYTIILESIEELNKKTILKNDEKKKLSIIRNKSFFLKKGVNEADINYYINNPEEKIYKSGNDLWINQGRNFRFYNTEIYFILEYGLEVGVRNTKILEIYWIHMIDLCNIYYYLVSLYIKYEIPFTGRLVNINKVCNNMKDKSKCNQSEYCNWNERGELNKQCEKKPIRWN